MLSLIKGFGRKKTSLLYTDQRFQVKKLLEAQFLLSRTVLLFYLDIINMSDIEVKYGYSAASKIIYQLDHILNAACHAVFRNNAHLVAVQKLWGDDYAIYISWDGTYSNEAFHLLCLELKREVEERLNRQITYSKMSKISVHIGYARMEGHDITKEMYMSVKFASQMAKVGLMSEEFKNMEHFHQIVENENVHTLLQPIVSLKTGIPLGWESLIRGPEGSNFHSPGALFSYAQKTGRNFEFESLCRRKAVENLKNLDSSYKLFINLDARSIDDPFLLRGQIFKWFEKYELNPHNIVFEITERHAIKNFASFRDMIQEYRKKGYLIAVDDAGAGYSSLEAIAEIYPDYIKMDMTLVRNIDVDPVKQALLETFVKFANKVKCKLIAEGIETESELEAVINLGVDYGQGFFLARPAKQQTSITDTAVNFIRRMEQQRKHLEIGEEFTNKVGDILTSTICVTKETTVREVHNIFERNHKIDGVVVLQDKQPVGLIMRFQIYQILGGQYGISLYYEKPISQIMNNSPLIVDKRAKIDEVAKLAMERESFHLYDVIIVTEKDNYLGIVSVQSLLDMLAKVQLELAVISNPLTGLPGNIRIEREIVARIEKRQDFSVIYCDLDRFKFFNDQYGFEIGDEIIRRTAQMFATAIRVTGSKGSFLGHIGGDDFIIITLPEFAKEIAGYVLSNFYTHFKNIMDIDFTDNEQNVLSISLASVRCSPDRYKNPMQVSEMAAKVKKASKKINGLSFVEDESLL
ncbi:GGDEF domain-containing protein [Aneurinibacillus terranovensis]|uniref:GGDEF domain-containing protein n=1 Tax=Aneurinibacillus terranovensis TaxID=278991 RepID=UPI000423563D|nr:GGDEF domain-containing protein [Aneurinibacillus terranovensis]